MTGHVFKEHPTENKVMLKLEHDEYGTLCVGEVGQRTTK
jgi:hypothetical protein